MPSIRTQIDLCPRTLFSAFKEKFGRSCPKNRVFTRGDEIHRRFQHQPQPMHQHTLTIQTRRNCTKKRSWQVLELSERCTTRILGYFSRMLDLQKRFRSMWKTTSFVSCAPKQDSTPSCETYLQGNCLIADTVQSEHLFSTLDLIVRMAAGQNLMTRLFEWIRVDYQNRPRYLTWKYESGKMSGSPTKAPSEIECLLPSDVAVFVLDFEFVGCCSNVYSLKVHR